MLGIYLSLFSELFLEAADPDTNELCPLPEEELNKQSDPLQEKIFHKIPGLLHKYYGRVLIITAAACLINCRYCFRKEFPYASNIASGKNLETIINYIYSD